MNAKHVIEAITLEENEQRLIKAYGPDWAKKLHLYKTATLNDEYVGIKAFKSQPDRYAVVVTKQDGSKLIVDARRLDHFGL